MLRLTADVGNFKKKITVSKLIALKEVHVKCWILYEDKIYIFPLNMGVSGSVPPPFAYWTLSIEFQVFSSLYIFLMKKS